MGLETATYISGLTSSWPPSGDPKNQGDDHIRLIKAVLQSTFPNGSKAFYFPTALAGAGPTPLVLTAANDKTTVYYTTTGGDAQITLPSGLTMADAGWWVEVVKYDVAANGVMVVPASGTIITQFGAVASVRVGSVCSPVKFVWGGAGWFSYRHGPVIGSTMNFDGPIPYGYFTLDGSTFNGTTYTELAAALGTTTLKDKRGRTDIGSGTGTGLTARVLGTNYGGESQQLATTHLPPQTPSGSINVGTVTINNAGNLSSHNVGVGGSFGSGGFGYDLNPSITATVSGSWTFSGTAMAGQNSTGFSLLQPSVATQKLIRAC